MSHKLDLIVPHYTEDPELMRPMLEILKLQRNVSMDDFRLLVVDDGLEIALPDGFGAEYPFEVAEVPSEHHGISGARNVGLYASDAEWVMWCDSDDAFLTTHAVHTLFAAGTEGKNIVTCAFLEECLDDGGSIVYTPYDGLDCKLIHGKMFRRSWLIDNEIAFSWDLKLYEDTYFMTLAMAIANEDEIASVETPLYLWQYNRKSVSRGYWDFFFQTFELECEKDIALMDELLRRGMYVEAKRVYIHALQFAYGLMRNDWQKWHGPEYAERWRVNRAAVSDFVKKYKYMLAQWHLSDSGKRWLDAMLEGRDEL